MHLFPNIDTQMVILREEKNHAYPPRIVQLGGHYHTRFPVCDMRAQCGRRKDVNVAPPSQQALASALALLLVRHLLIDCTTAVALHQTQSQWALLHRYLSHRASIPQSPALRRRGSV